MTRIAHEINAVVTVAARDITYAVKTPQMLAMNLLMPIIMMGMLGGSLSQNMAGGLGFDYGQYMMIGMMVNLLFMGTTMGVTSLIQDRTQDFTQEMMISPVSRYSIVIGKILGASFQALLQLVGTIIVALIMRINFSFSQILSFLALSPFICLSAGAVGMAIVGFVKSDKVANILVSIVVMPQMFLSGAIIPINHSKGVLYVLSRMMPMTYSLDLARSVFYAGTKEYSKVVLFNPFVNAAVLTGLTLMFLVIGTVAFAKSEVNR
ncbi:MAG: ABC transporter permease [Clostridioides sp.]|nr:ABC transporter permease [Clostridioides sp.]